MKLTSLQFEHNTRIPIKYTCEGEDINPSLTISDVPAAAKSLVLIMDDPDVPKQFRPDGMWDHWIKFNIPAVTTVIEEGREPEGISGLGTSGNLKYHGPCPPDGEHRYTFKLYALDTQLNLSEGVTKKEVEVAMQHHILDEAVLIGLYEKENK